MAEQNLFIGERELRVGQHLGPHFVVSLLRVVGDGRHSDLGFFRRQARVEPLPPGGFTLVKVLRDAICGKVHSARMHGKGDAKDELVVVKKMPHHMASRNKNTETSEWNLHLRRAPLYEVEDAMNEIGVFTYLSGLPDASEYLLKSLGAFQDSCSVWLVTEFAEGGELFDHVASGAQYTETQVKSVMRQLLGAVQFLHEHRIGHRDISLENILLKDGKIKLMDFGMAAQTHSETCEVMRYFLPLGKDTYRPPEMYVPRGEAVSVLVPTGASTGEIIFATTESRALCEVRLPPTAVPGERCEAALAGYSISPADIFSSGCCMFILKWQCPAWKRAQRTDQTFAFIHDQGDSGIANTLKHWKRPLMAPDGMELLTTMLRSDPSKRPTVADCLAHAWFQPSSNAVGFADTAIIDPTDAS